MQAGISAQRQGWAAAKPPPDAAIAARTTPAAGTPMTTAFSRLGKLVKAVAVAFS